MKYTDPDGRSDVKQHTDLKHTERLTAEFCDCFGATFKTGLAGSFEINLIGIFSILVTINAGSVEATQDKNGITVVDTLGIKLAVVINGIGTIEVGKEWECEPVLDDKEPRISDEVFNVWKNGKSKDKAILYSSLGGSLIGLTANSTENNAKIQIGAMLGIGFDVWVDLPELFDFLKYLLKEYPNE